MSRCHRYNLLAAADEEWIATYKQRLALRAMHPTCAVEGCDMDYDWCEMLPAPALAGPLRVHQLDEPPATRRLAQISDPSAITFGNRTHVPRPTAST